MRSLSILNELARQASTPPGDQAFIEADQTVYFSMGSPSSEIVERLGWPNRTDWLPDHALVSIRRKHQEFPRRIDSMAWVLMNASYVNVESNAPQVVRFLVNATEMRAAGLLASRTARVVDLLVEFPQLGDETLLRAFHRSPAKHGPEGRSKWP